MQCCMVSDRYTIFTSLRSMCLLLVIYILYLVRVFVSSRIAT